MTSAAQLEQRIRNGIPLAAHMDFRVRELSPDAITVIGGAAENVNVHGTAFAGSLYAVCTLALWGLVNSRLPAAASLVLVDGSIRYRAPVVGDIVARCSIPGDRMDAFLHRLERQGKARLEAVVEVPGKKGVAAQYSGQVHARLDPETAND